MSYKRGDVVIVSFPNSDLTTYKRRPALVVQSDVLNTRSHQTIVAMITTNLERGGPTKVAVPDGDVRQEMGLSRASMIACDNLATVLNKEVLSVAGHRKSMRDVDTALSATFNLL